MNSSSSKTRKMLGSLLVGSGAVLLGLYAVPTVYGNVMSRIAVAQFRHQSAANSLWDPARVQAHQASLSVSFAPPEAVLRVPKVGIEVPLLEGTSDLAMNRGVGHVAGTALPGQPGNLAISGHRDGFFRPLKDVVLGDLIEVDRPARPGEISTSGQHTDRYVVRNIRIVSPSDTSVLHRTADSTLTLITCYPFYYIGPAPGRYIVQASLLPTSPAAPNFISTASIPTASGD